MDSSQIGPDVRRDVGRWIHVYGLLNLLFILVIQFFALWWRFKELRPHETTFLSDATYSIRAAVNYALVIVIFGIAYYSFIDQEFDQQRIKAAVEFTQQQASDPEYFEELKQLNPQMPPDATPEEYVENAREQATRHAKWHFRAGTSLLLLTLMSIFNSVFVTLLFRKVLLK